MAQTSVTRKPGRNRFVGCLLALVLLLLFLGIGVGCGSAPSVIVPPTQTATPPSPPPSPTIAAPTLAPAKSATLTLTPPPSPTSTLTPLPRPSATLKPTVAPSPQVISFTIAPTATNGVGQKILATWQAKGERAEICGIVGTGPTDCQTVPLAGQKSIVTTEASAAYVQMGLRVTTGQSVVWSFVYVCLCKDASKYFFDNPRSRCPDGPALYSRGAAEYFEHGFMIWIQQTDESYVFYQDGSQQFDWWTGPLILLPGGSVNNRVGGAPPGLYEPVSGFGLIWRGEIDNSAQVRARLGWATAPEFAYDAAYQCEEPPMMHLWTCYLREPGGKVLRLGPDSTAQVHFIWDEF